MGNDELSRGDLGAKIRISEKITLESFATRKRELKENRD